MPLSNSWLLEMFKRNSHPRPTWLLICDRLIISESSASTALCRLLLASCLSMFKSIYP